MAGCEVRPFALPIPGAFHLILWTLSPHVFDPVMIHTMPSHTTFRMTPPAKKTTCTPVAWNDRPKGSIDITGFSHGEEGLAIQFGFWENHSEEPSIIKSVLFDGYFAFRAMDEGLRLSDEALVSEALNISPIIIVHNSPLCLEVVRSSAGTVPLDWLTHYLLVSENLCIDVVVGVGIEPKFP